MAGRPEKPLPIATARIVSAGDRTLVRHGFLFRVLDYADGDAKVGLLSDNAKALREYVLANFEQGRRGQSL